MTPHRRIRQPLQRPQTEPRPQRRQPQGQRADEAFLVPLLDLTRSRTWQWRSTTHPVDPPPAPVSQSPPPRRGSTAYRDRSAARETTPPPPATTDVQIAHHRRLGRKRQPAQQRGHRPTSRHAQPQGQPHAGDHQVKSLFHARNSNGGAAPSQRLKGYSTPQSGWPSSGMPP